MYDLIIKNGSILDGTGTPAYRADVAIQDGKIARIGRNLTGGKEEIDAAGLTVTPGFIDSHSHSDSTYLQYPDQTEKVEQGITTAIGGNCGSSVAPMRMTGEAFQVGEFGKNTDVLKTVGTFLDTAKTGSFGANLALFAGHSSLRAVVMGMDNREPTREELEKMAALLEEAMDHGALGISFGLIYTPGSFAKTEELIYLANVAAERGGMICAHIRDEGYQLTNACEEFIRIVKASGARGVLSHHKVMYRDNWGKVSHTLRLIDRANAEGCDIFMDTYPYTASHTSLCARFIPKEYCAGGDEALFARLADPAVRETIRKINQEKFGTEDDLSWCLLVKCPGMEEYVGMRLNEIAQKRGQDVYDTVFDLIIGSRNLCHGCFFLMCEEDLETVLAHPRCMICTDSGVRGVSDAYHPRLRGSFPRALGRYVRERGVVPLSEMIRKMTAMPAAVYGLDSKGLLKVGMDADICILDAGKIIDRCDYTACHERAEGLNYVLVGGRIAVRNGVYTGVRAGGILA